MKNIFLKLILITTVLFFTVDSFAQTPQFFNGASGTSTNVFPLGTATSNKVQWVFGPGTLTSLGGGLGTPAPFGSINKVYFRTGTIVNPTNVYNLTVSMVQNQGTITSFPNATYVTGLTQTFTDPNFTFTGVMPNTWYGIELQTNFPYNPNLSLICELKQTGGTGNSVAQTNTIPNARIWGGFAATTGSTGAGLVDFGIDIGADSLFHCQGAPPLTLQTSNTGTITWSVVTGSATLSSTTGTTITALPTSPSMVTATSNANTIADTFYITPVRAIVDAGPDQLSAGCAPFADTMNGGLSDITPGINYDISWLPSANITSAGNTLNAIVNHSVNTVYTLVVTSSPGQGGCQFTDSMEVTIDDYTPDASFTPDFRLGCINDTVCFTNTSIENPNGVYDYNWNFGNTLFSTDENPCAIYGAQALYNVRLIVTDTLYGCTDRDSIDVDVRHPLLADFAIANNGIAADDSICVGNTFIFSPITQPTAGTANMTFDWDFGNGVTRMNAGPLQQNYVYPDAGTFDVKLVLTDTLGCQDSVSYTVFVDIPAYINSGASPDEVCIGEKVYFTDSVSPNTILTVYDFDDGNVLQNIHNPVHTYERAGIYTVNFLGQYLVCPDTDTNLVITVSDYPRIDLGPDVDLCPGLDTVALLTNQLNPAEILEWSNGETAPSILVGLNGIGTYYASTSNNGCETTDSITVKRDCYLNIPNSFSPNSDGRNDYFLPRDMLSSGVKEYSMKIFNRWGEMIFTTDKVDGRGWDGKLNGEEQPMGVYVYMIEARWNNGFKNSFTGNVTLLR